MITMKSKGAPIQSTKAVWVAVELYHDVDLNKHRQNVEKELAKLYKGVETYIPVHDEVINGKRYFTVLSEGYAYIKYPGTKAFDDILYNARGNYVSGPLMCGRRDTFAVLPQSYIDKLKSLAKDSFAVYTPKVGDKVTVQHETLSGMDGVIHEVDMVEKRAVVHIKMRSQEVVAVVPFTNIEAKNDLWEDSIPGGY